MVIVLIGVLSYGANSLFSSRAAFSSYVAKDLLISQALLAQQVALGGQAPGHDPVSLTVSVSGDDWVFSLLKPFDGSTTADDLDLIRSQESSGGDLIINGTTLADGDSQVFTWDQEGSLVSATNYNILFDGESSYRVCLSASGFAYDGSEGCP